MSETLLSWVIVGVLVLVFWTPFLMAKGISSLEGKVTIGEKVICSIPIVNIARAEIKYYGKIGLTTIATISCIAAIVFRITAWWKFYSNTTLGTVSIIVFLLAILFYIFANCKFVYNVIHDADAVHGSMLILYTVLFPIGQFYIGHVIAGAVKANMQREATFKG